MNTSEREIDGVLNIYKSQNLTSHDVIVKLRRLIKIRKIGHTGTLDPQATGVLLICLGQATKLSSWLSSKGKEYIAGMKIGVVTDTQDIWGSILSKKEPVNLKEEQIKEAFLRFTGEITQVPPMYSAVKWKGKKLYQLARKGYIVERAPRKVMISSLELISYQEDSYPEVVFKVSCSTGTYIRTLCEDIGNYLGYGGCLSSLVRTRIDSFLLEDTLTLEKLTKIIENDLLFNYLIPIEKVLNGFS
ncbi:tRNA pseudouridine(55) synthase TruB [bacterium]|nr:tRNA pseudouridine(55) synthase TruB [bacterium]MBU0899615.1 tRNA pseudouridine(55) synthase TruB [bacterium]MBU1153907.1 tRNA pseudouridine(55) synthase TruB [bacterium]